MATDGKKRVQTHYKLLGLMVNLQRLLNDSEKFILTSAEKASVRLAEAHLEAVSELWWERTEELKQ